MKPRPIKLVLPNLSKFAIYDIQAGKSLPCSGDNTVTVDLLIDISQLVSDLVEDIQYRYYTISTVDPNDKMPEEFFLYLRTTDGGT